MILVSSVYRRFFTKRLQTVNRCPRIGCNGELRFSVCGDLKGKVCGGYVGDKIAAYRCQKCNIGFHITNPRSFITE